VNPPSHLEGVSACPVGCVRVAVDFAIGSIFPCAYEYCTIYCVEGSQGSADMFPYGFAETCMKIWQFDRGGGVIGMGAV
jgi:hypothetical protein